MRKEQYQALSKADRKAYLAAKKITYHESDYYIRKLKPRRELARLERIAERLRKTMRGDELRAVKAQIAEFHNPPAPVRK